MSRKLTLIWYTKNVAELDILVRLPPNRRCAHVFHAPRIAGNDGEQVNKGKARRLSKKDWVFAARRRLISRSIAEVKVEPLARQLHVTAGSFYWHFRDREALYDALLDDWFYINTTPLFDAVAAAGTAAENQYLAFFGVWVLENSFIPEYDQAIRDWSRISAKVADVLRDVDRKRIELLKAIFENFGYHGIDAELRAKVTYYHQVGYYAMFEHESQQRRIELAPYYAEILTGSKWMHDFSSPQEICTAMLKGTPKKPGKKPDNSAHFD